MLSQQHPLSTLLPNPPYHPLYHHPISPPSLTTPSTPLPNPLYHHSSGRSGRKNSITGLSEGGASSSSYPLALASLSSDNITSYAQQLSSKIIWGGGGGGGTGQLGQPGGGGPVNTPSVALSDPPSFKLVPLRRKISSAKPQAGGGSGSYIVKSSQKSNYDSDSSDETIRTTARLTNDTYILPFINYLSH